MTASGDEDSIDEMCNAIAKSMLPYRVVFKKNRFSVVFLDMQVSLVGGKVVTAPAVKFNHVGAPFSHTSHHPQWCHTRWPICRCAHLARLSTGGEQYQEAHERLWNKLHWFSPGHPSLDRIATLATIRKALYKQTRVQTERFGGTSVKMKFHRVYAARFSKALRDAYDAAKHLASGDIARLLEPRASWRLAGPHMVHILEKNTRERLSS